MYLLEKLPHLKQLKLWFQLSAPSNRYCITIESKFVVFGRKDSIKKCIKICFDCEIDKDKATSFTKNSIYFLTLPIIQDTYTNETDDFPTANELDIRNYSLISCRFCSHTFYNHSLNNSNNVCNKLNKIYPLPSEYWLELSDMWFCCQSHQIDFNAQEITAKKNSLLIGKLHFIIHQNNIIKDSIKRVIRIIDDEYSVQHLSNNEKKRKLSKINHSTCSHTTQKQQKQHTQHTQHVHTSDHGHTGTCNSDHKSGAGSDDCANDDDQTSWDGVQAFNCYCNRCNTLIGISYKTVDDDYKNDTKLDEYHLWKFETMTEGKYTIPYSRNLSHMDNVYHWYKIENYFSTKMIEIKNARMIHKFLVYDYHYTIFIRINLISTKCFIKCSLFIKSSESNKMAPVLKLMFVDSSNNTFQQNKEWINQQNGQIITSSTENCGLLLEYLNKYNKLYPMMIQKQKFPFGMKLTFIRKLSRTFNNDK